MKNGFFKGIVALEVIASSLILGGKYTYNHTMAMAGVIIFAGIVVIAAAFGVTDAIKDAKKQYKMSELKKEHERQAQAQKELAASVAKIIKTELSK